jgi:hypothetical protein
LVKGWGRGREKLLLSIKPNQQHHHGGAAPKKNEEAGVKNESIVFPLPHHHLILVRYVVYPSSQKSPSQMPKIRPIANLLSSKLLQYKLENPKISQFTKKSPNFQSHHQSPISKVQKISNLKGTKPDRHNYYYFRQ